MGLAETCMLQPIFPAIGLNFLGWTDLSRDFKDDMSLLITATFGELSL